MLANKASNVFFFSLSLERTFGLHTQRQGPILLKVSFRIVCALSIEWLTKVIGSSSRNNLALWLLSVRRRCMGYSGVPYGAAALEENDLLAWSSTVAKCADSLGRLVGISSQEVVQALVTDGGQEPLTSPVYQHGILWKRFQ